MSESVPSNEVEISLPLNVTPYPYGRQGYGFGRYGGDHPVNIVPSTVDRKILFLVANDRYQTVANIDIGNAIRAPRFRYWNAQPHLWPELLGDPSLPPPIFAVDEKGTPVTGRVELHATVPAQRGELTDAQIDGVVVEFIPRPSIIKTLDGGVPADVPIAITGTVEVYGLEKVAVDDGLGRLSGPVEAHVIDLNNATDITEQSSLLWPNVRAAWFPVRSDLRARAFRVVLYFTLCEFVSARLIGQVDPSRIA